jgi:hypothetical protein
LRTDEWADGYDEANCRFSPFCESAEKENINNNKKNNGQDLWGKRKEFKCESEKNIAN